MVAITNPLRYEQVLTRTRCYAIICVLWLVGALIAGIVTYNVDSWDFNTCIHNVNIDGGNVGLIFIVVIIAILCPVSGLVYSTARIFRAILRTHRQITAQGVSTGGENDNAPIESLTMKSIRSGRNVLIVCLALIVLTNPYFILATIALFGSRDDMPLRYSFWGHVDVCEQHFHKQPHLFSRVSICS